MTSLFWGELAILWVVISIEVMLWLSPRLFRHLPKDEE